jgi:two-component system sensor histidine kinase/response regulator
MNISAALSRVDGDSPLLAELAAIFLQEYPILLCQVRDSILQRDHVGLERGAHTLKGRLDFFAIEEVQILALRLEMTAKDHDWSGARKTLKIIETGMVHVLQEFELLSRDFATTRRRRA